MASSLSLHSSIAGTDALAVANLFNLQDRVAVGGSGG